MGRVGVGVGVIKQDFQIDRNGCKKKIALAVHAVNRGPLSHTSKFSHGGRSDRPRLSCFSARPVFDTYHTDTVIQKRQDVADLEEKRIYHENTNENNKF